MTDYCDMYDIDIEKYPTNEEEEIAADALSWGLGMQGSRLAKDVVQAMVEGNFDFERDFNSKIQK